MNRIEQIIEDIEIFLDEAKGSAFSKSKVTVNKEELSEMLVELRQAIPDEVAKCQKILANQEAIISDAKQQAGRLVADAQEKKAELVDEHEIMQKAYEEADKTISDARDKAQKMIEAATNESNSIKESMLRYTDDILNRLQTLISHSLDSAGKNFANYENSLRSSYELITSNREALREDDIKEAYDDSTDDNAEDNE